MTDGKMLGMTIINAVTYLSSLRGYSSESNHLSSLRGKALALTRQTRDILLDPHEIFDDLLGITIEELVIASPLGHGKPDCYWVASHKFAMTKETMLVMTIIKLVLNIPPCL
jgi:hypothetical protein